MCILIEFSKQNTKLPIIVKGVQSVEDVQLCVDHGVRGVILVSQANHLGASSIALMQSPKGP